MQNEIVAFSVLFFLIGVFLFITIFCFIRFILNEKEKNKKEKEAINKILKAKKEQRFKMVNKKPNTSLFQANEFVINDLLTLIDKDINFLKSKVYELDKEIKNSSDLDTIEQKINEIEIIKDYSVTILNNIVNIYKRVS